VVKHEPTIAGEPLPTRQSSSANFHRLTRTKPGVLWLEPGRALWVWGLALLGATPILPVICLAAKTPNEMTAVFTIAWFVAAAGLTLVAWCYRRFGTRARFDRGARRVVITGERHAGKTDYSFDDLCAVQFCDAGRKGDEGSWHAFQVNLVLHGDPPHRLNLLDSGGETQLRRLAEQIAEFCGVPLYVGSRRV